MLIVFTVHFLNKIEVSSFEYSIFPQKPLSKLLPNQLVFALLCALSCTAGIGMYRVTWDCVPSYPIQNAVDKSALSALAPLSSFNTDSNAKNPIKT